MSTKEHYRLDIWKGDWGLPSVDIDCLRILAYAKFCGVTLEINPTCNPFRTPNGRLPLLHTTDNRRLNSVQDILEHFRQDDNLQEYALAPKECARVLAYDHMLQEKLFPALQYIWWIDKSNFEQLVRPWYAKATPFPWKFWYPRRYENGAQDLMDLLFPNEDNPNAIENKVYSEAQKCMTFLDSILGQSEFFSGSRPTSLDALIYAYLAPLLKAPLPNPALQNHLKACTNLVSFVSRISQRYFKNDYQTYERVRAAESEKKMRQNEDIDFPNKRRNQLIAGFCAILAMAGYALSNGIVKVSIGDDEDGTSDEPEDYMFIDADPDD